MNVILCGMPGSGKTYYGALAAKRLQRKFIDTDDLISNSYYRLTGREMTCRDIAKIEGVSFFREIETAAIKELAGIQESIIALGGGALCNPENVRQLSTLGWILYLKAEPEQLLKRLMRRQPLPSYINSDDIQGSFDALLLERLPLYEKNSHAVLDVNSEHVIEIISNFAQKDINHGN